MCLFPRLIRNKKYTINKKNGGNVPPVKDERTKLVPVGCQKCIECVNQKRREWQVRLLEDIRHNKNGIFITLTFSNESIKELGNEIKGLSGYELDNEIAKLAVRRFLERWRKKHKKSVRHWLVTELGQNSTENIHLHGIIWTNESLKEIEDRWQYGFIWPKPNSEAEKTNYVNEKTINYITKYISKADDKHKEYKSKILTSAGIGRGYLSRPDSKLNGYKENNTKEHYKTRTGHKIALPIYWRNQIYSEEEREKLWLEKLDKQERWIMGEKIDISKNEESYYKTLEHYRDLNKRLGYGDDSINWERKNYENERRKIMIATRIAKANEK